ncbi:MAG: hypothetical protein WCK71_01875, partial [bacterium]
QVLKDLDEYCALDTLAMVEIYNFLVERASGKTADEIFTEAKMSEGPVPESRPTEPEQLSIDL